MKASDRSAEPDQLVPTSLSFKSLELKSFKAIALPEHGSSAWQIINSIKSDRGGKTHRMQAQPAGRRKIVTAKKGIGSYRADDPESGPSGGETGGKNEVNLDERMGSNNRGKKATVSSPILTAFSAISTATGTRWDDAPGSGTPEDNP
jgi:hypothetical protein